MRTRSIVILAVTLLLVQSFSFQVSAQEVGLAMTGELMNSTFTTVAGQVILSQVLLINTGQVSLSVSFVQDVMSGPVNGVVASLPHTLNITPETSVRCPIEFFVNTSEYVAILIQAVGVGPKFENMSSATTSVATRIEFFSGGAAYNFSVRCIDQFGFSYQGLQLNLRRNRTLYTTQTTDDLGTTSFIVANGTYQVRISEEGIVKKTMEFNVFENRSELIVIERSRPDYRNPYEIHAIELVIGCVVGFIYARRSGIRAWISRRREYKCYEPTSESVSLRYTRS